MLLGLSLAWACAALFFCRRHVLTHDYLVFVACAIVLAYAPWLLWGLVAYGLWVSVTAPRL